MQSTAIVLELLQDDHDQSKDQLCKLWNVLQNKQTCYGTSDLQLLEDTFIFLLEYYVLIEERILEIGQPSDVPQ